MSDTILFDEDLIRRHDRQGPRYTSYPTAVQFHEGFGEAKYRAYVRDSNEDLVPAPLSLYFHIPFCATVCYYCACNRVVTKNREHAEGYLQSLVREIERQGALFNGSRPVEQLHWGGGTPTFLSETQMQRLMEATRKHFNLRTDDRGESCIEVDPRTVGEATISHLRGIGFNRLSLGVQDFDPRVQVAVNRIQSEEQTLAVMAAARTAGFRSISVDLIYGLPYQSVESFDRTLRKVIAASPDRLSVFNYAHLPERFKTQRQIDAAALPPAEEKLRILQRTIELLTGAGYVYIGMDHFAKPGDELARAQRSGDLSRNFQGYSTHGDYDVVGMGMSAIGMVGDCYAQNERQIGAYRRRIDEDGLAVFRGIELTPDDRLRRDVIMALICHFDLDVARIARRHGVDFWNYFAAEREALDPLAADGLIAVDEGRIRILPAGRLLIRNVCMVFDAYVSQGGESTGRFSRVI